MKVTWTTPLPIYVTRENASGEIGTFSMASYITLPAMFLFFVNVIVWGVVGLVEAVRVLT